ncbi:MAG: bile acid:sodium symporter family protein [Prevotella sp.]|jgi:BASS family bile acid:Na+ symporter|nr:bile acid:sodium symporter family protein [Prevotella sp.]
MNSIFIVLPILTLLMFDLGLTLQPRDFVFIVRKPRAALVGLFGQLIMLPLIAYAIASLFSLPPIFFIGVMLIACCPGGSSSNIFSMLAKGDVALSVSLTALSSIITLVTVPAIMQWVTVYVGASQGIQLPVVNLLMQNVFTMLAPIVLGILCRKYYSNVAMKMDRVLSKIAFPALMLLAGIFFVQHYDTITTHFSVLGMCVGLLLLTAVALSGVGSRCMRLNNKERRTIVIEVGMQNAAQAIAVASSPFVFNDGRIAIPAIIYALLMNVVLLTYVSIIKVRAKGKEQ